MLKKDYGLDHGHYSMKIMDTADNKDCYRSTFKKGKKTSNSFQTDTIEISYDNTKLILGKKDGQYTLGEDKFKSEITKAQTFASICRLENNLDTKEDVISANLVVGIPITAYKAGKADEFTDTILNYGKKKVTVNGITRTININNVYCFMQGAGAIMLNQQYAKDSNLIIDIGGWTIDVAEFSEGIQLENCKSYSEKGIITFYSNLADALNIKYSAGFTYQKAENFIQKGYMPLNGKKENINKYITEVKSDYIDDITNLISTDFNPKSVDNILIVGGPSEFCLPTIKQNEHYSNAVNIGDVYINARAYAEIAKRQFK